MKNNLGTKLLFMQEKSGYTPSEFSSLVGLSLDNFSSYTQTNQVPSLGELVNISKVCHVSMDWLCGLSEEAEINYEISHLGKLARDLFKINEINEINIDIHINDNFPDGIETNENRWFTQLTIYGSDFDHSSNADLCNIITSISETIQAFEKGEISLENYKKRKSNIIQSYSKSLSLTSFTLPKLPLNERLEREAKEIEKMVR